MRIGELSRRTGVSTRSLRYYEQRGLLRARRDTNDYRSYGPDSADTVARIRELLAAGMNTDAIRDLLPCAQGGPALISCALSRAVVERQMAQLDEEIEKLLSHREALGAYERSMRERRTEDEALPPRALRSA